MVKINMMSWKRNFGDDWIHIGDAEDGWGKKLTHIHDTDIFLKAQFDGTIDLIYCSHGIAYFDKQGGLWLLKQWFKKLRPGGKIEIATPNWDILKLMKDPLLGPLYGKMSVGDNNGEVYHKTVYSFDTLKTALEAAGFTDVKLYDHRQTCHPNTGERSDKYDDHSAAYIDGVLISLNVEASKPL